MTYIQRIFVSFVCVYANIVNAGDTSMVDVALISEGTYQHFNYGTTSGGYSTVTVIANISGEGVLSRVQARLCSYIRLVVDDKEFVANTVDEVSRMFYVNSIFGGRTSSYYTGGNFLFKNGILLEVQGTDPSCYAIVAGVNKF